MRFRTYFASERRKPTVLSHLYAGRNHMTRNLRIISQPNGGLSPSFPKAFQRMNYASWVVGPTNRRPRSCIGHTTLIILCSAYLSPNTMGFSSFNAFPLLVLTRGVLTHNRNTDPQPLRSWCVTTQYGLPLRYSYFWHIEVNYSSPFPAIQASLSQLVYPRQALQFLKGDWRGSNPRSLEPQSTALPTKLQPPYAR